MNPYLDVWNVSYKNFPSLGTVSDQVRFLLKYAILAPSTHNIQPWLFQVGENSCIFLFDPKAYLPHGDKEQRYASISIGASLENFVIACCAFQMNPIITYTPDEKIFAYVQVEKSRGFDISYEKILKAITERVNVRGVFEQKQIPDAIISQFKEKSIMEDCTVHICTDKESIRSAAEATAQGLRKAHADTAFRQEMAQRIISNISKSPVGIPGYTMNLPLVPSLIVPTLIYHKDLSSVLSKLNYKSIISASAVCVITTHHWNKKSWIKAGQVFERVVLDGQSNNISSSVYVAATEFEDTARKLQVMLKTDERPVFFFCMGYMKKKYKHAQRIPVEQKIIA